MIQIVLYQPEIPQNSGNIARLCAATGAQLHLIKPLGFSLEDKYLKRAGLDYWDKVSLSVWENFEEYANNAGVGRRFVTTSAKAGTAMHKFDFEPTDSLIFGPETRGISQDIFERCHERVWIPQLDTVRSLNLANCAGILLYQALNSCNLLDNFSGYHKH